MKYIKNNGDSIPKSFAKTYACGQKYLIMVKLAETLIKSSEQLFFIPPVIKSVCRHKWQLIYEGIYECEKCKKQKAI